MKNIKSASTLRWISNVVGRKKIYILILLVVQIVLGISSVFYALILRGVIDEAVAKDSEGFFYGIAAFLGLVLFQILLRAINRFLEEYSRATMENCFKERLFTFLLNCDYGSFSEVHSGEWMNRITSDTVVVADGLAQIIPIVAGMLVKMVGAVAMILILEQEFIYILIPGGILLISLTYVFRKALKRFHRKVQESDGYLRVFLQESFCSMLVLRTFVKEEQTLESASEKMEAHKKARMKKNHFSNICNIGFGGVMQGAYVLGVGFCGYGILIGTMSYGTLMAILQLISQIQSPFANITGYIPKYYAMLVSGERLMEAEGYDEEIEIKHKKLKSISEIYTLYENYFSSLTLCNVDFTYKSPVKNSDTEMSRVVKAVNMKIEKGDYVAFTGPSGCGKSTILKLLMCLYPLDKGKRWIDIKHENSLSSNGFKDDEVQKRVSLTADYRRLFAYVPQENHLMSGTIGQIVAYSDKEAIKDEDRIWKALRIACAEDFVKELPLGLNTFLGERGLGLSEGQMQRIAIARAIFSDNPILIFDESTSALDEKTEELLLCNLRAMTNKTVIIVTHRKSVLKICDKEIMFQEGNIRVRNLI
ncbi:ABC transporter ATP-binding protein [Haloimpatiens sp. FM7315]|uniref:ABC transporter ATP-binding protein n=1 Tax=Haloimpatiens sp. FM7315 TaxID=3298609 RepID=UPI00370ACB9C